jgi:CubicO group peptidase (beta-lactamase class C family)
MLRKSLVFSLIVVLLAAGGCTPGYVNKALDTACDASGCISLSKFSADIDTALQGSVVGYVSLVGALPVMVKYGKARTAADAPSLAWDTDVPMNIASLSKVLTTIGVLQSLANHNPALTINSKIAPFLPPDWTKGPNVNTITFKDLLTHSAGFRESGDTYAAFQQQIADGVQLSDKSIPSYNNMNFAIFRVLLPYMEGFNDPGPANRANATATFYVTYMRQHVFQPLGITGVDCKPGAGSHPALSYPPPPIGATHGTDWGDWTLSCGGGGWVMTAGDLYKVMLDLAGGNVLLSDAQKTQMNTDCLGWDCSVQTQTDYVGKNGILQTGSLGLWTFFGIFKGTVPVIVLVNSNTPGNITGIVATAFANASVPHP